MAPVLAAMRPAPIRWPPPAPPLNGWENRFHYWWKDAIRLNFGSSYSGRSVNALIGSSLKYTLGLNLVSFCFAFLIGLGFVLLAYFFENKVRWIHTLTSFLFAIPRFWLAAILFFAHIPAITTKPHTD